VRVISAVVLSALLGSCAPGTPLLDQIRTAGELRVITQNAPTTYYYGANERYGIEYELARAFADHLGVRLNMTMADQIPDMIPTLTEHRAHVAAAGLVVTESRSRRVAFGPAYQGVRPQLIYRMGTTRPESLEDLERKTVEVRAGTSHVELLYRALERVPNLSFAENRSSSEESLMRRVADGTIDYAVVNSNAYELLRHYYPEVQVAFDIESGSKMAWALPYGAADLEEEVGKFFASFEASGQLQRLLDRYYDAHREFDYVDLRAFARHLRERFPKYQNTFRAAARETGIDWRVLAAIAYQESHWDAEAVSPTGVEGLMMLTAKTAQRVGITDRTDPHESILGGASYLKEVLEKFPERIPYEDRLFMAIAAYNIGFGHVEDARIITESSDADKDSWEDVREHLPLLADESWYPALRRGYAQGSIPVQYVENVRYYLWLLEGMRGMEILSALGDDNPRAAASGDPI
jgi:membrane-bound lytic murein transglycosylase F